MRIVFLGTAAAIPTARRGLACVCLERDGRILMFDVGEGAQRSFAEASLGWNRTMDIFVTHMHGDHCLGLVGLLQSMSLRGRTKPVSVYGPVGIGEYVRENMRMLNFSPAFTLSCREVTEGVICGGDGYVVKCCRARHTVPAYAYLVEEGIRPGRFHPDRALALGVPRGKMWGVLQSGRSVRVGQATVRPDQVLGVGRPGKRVGYSGDTRPTKKLERFFAKCDYLVFDSTFARETARRAAATGHSTGEEAATLAKNAGVRNLILTHFSARYGDGAVPLEEARGIHGSVIAADDFMSVVVES